jgi:hypothetical protein
LALRPGSDTSWQFHRLPDAGLVPTLLATTNRNAGKDFYHLSQAPW